MSNRARIVPVVAVMAVAALVSVFGRTMPARAASPTQPVVSVQLTRDEAGQFQSALASLVRQAHVALVAEDAPRIPKLSVAKIPDLTAAMPLDQAVAKIAAAYDYDAQRQGDVFIFTKRYTDSRDLPCVTLEECVQAFATVSEMLDVFNPNLSTSVYTREPDGQQDVVVHFFQSLSSSQLQAAQSKTLRYGSLSPEQQTLIQKFFLNQYVQMPFLKVQEAHGNLSHASHASITVRDPEGDAGLFLEMANFHAGPPKIYITLTPASTPKNQPPPSMFRVTTPPIPDPIPSAYTTLEKLVSGLKPVDGKAPAVDASLAGKAVTAFGTDNVDTTAMLSALAVLYGLTVQERHKERTWLMPRSVHLPERLQDLDAAVWASLPVSYVRALHLAPTGPATLGVADAFFADFDNQMRLMQLPEDLQTEANRRLLLAIQPQYKKQGLKVRAAVSSLDGAAQSALAISLMAEAISRLNNGFNGFAHQTVRDCLDNMDQTVIYTVAGEDAHIDNQDVPSLYLEGTDLYTKKPVGLSGVRYFSRN